MITQVEDSDSPDRQDPDQFDFKQHACRSVLTKAGRGHFEPTIRQTT
jgi:hypothetical protein